jgi:hypothetical protein
MEIKSKVEDSFDSVGAKGISRANVPLKSRPNTDASGVDASAATSTGSTRSQG